MAVITPDTFDPLRAYIGVRLQQGVPLVDADWNEAHDVRKFEVQAFLKWFVGNGVPEGNDGFRIAGLDRAAVGDFVIQRGVGAAPEGTNQVERGLRHVGRCLVDGMDILIAKDHQFRAQPLHVSQGETATALAAAWGVPTIAEVPNDTGTEVVTVVVYLDVWERLVTPVEDDKLVHSALGVESCARLKREWVVRARKGTSVPAPDDRVDFIAGHSYYALATIAHQAGVAITDEAITDQRERWLLMPPATLITDVFGTTPADYRRGQGRPVISIREAINALLRGELPSSPETKIAPSISAGPFARLRTFFAFFDDADALITTWFSTRTEAPQIFASQLLLARPDTGFGQPQQITDGPAHSFPHATRLNTGEVLIVYQTGMVTTPGDILMKRGTLKTLHESEEKVVTATGASENLPFAVAVGGQVLILWWAGNVWQFSWYDVTNRSFTQPDNLSPGLGGRLVPPLLHAVRDSTDRVWVAFENNDQSRSFINVIPVPLDGSPGPHVTLNSPGLTNVQPFVMVDHDNNVWVFWRGGSTPGTSGIWYRRFLRGDDNWEPPNQDPISGTTAGLNSMPTAVSDAEGGIWLFWVSNRRGRDNIWYVRRNLFTQTWSEPKQVTGHTEANTNDENPCVLHGPDGSLWLFWNRVFQVQGQRESALFYRRIIPSI